MILQISTFILDMINVSALSQLTHALDKNLYGLKDLGLGSGTFLKCQTGIKSVREHAAPNSYIVAEKWIDSHLW